MRSHDPTPRRRRRAPRALLALATVVLGLLLPLAAFARGSVKLANRQPEENDGRWKLQMTIDLGAPPDLAHVPMNFIFTATSYMERFRDDAGGEEVKTRRVPLSNQQPIIKSMDVGFMDGTGKIWKGSKFDFVINRGHGFEAGDYTLEIKLSDGTPVGHRQQVTLKGNNEIIDRRAVIFAGKGGDKKGGDKGGEKAGEKKEEKPAGEGSSDGESASGATGAAGTETASAEGTEAPASEEPAAAPPPVPPKQGGCGCRVATGGAPAQALLVPGGLLLLAFVRRAARRARRA